MKHRNHSGPAPSTQLHRAIRRQVAEAVEQAVASAQTAYRFDPGSYTAQALSDALAVRERLQWLADLDDGVSR